jgi:hypothetical protein
MSRDEGQTGDDRRYSRKKNLHHKGHQGHKGKSVQGFSFVSFVSLVVDVIVPNCAYRGGCLTGAGVIASQRASPVCL